MSTPFATHQGHVDVMWDQPLECESTLREAVFVTAQVLVANEASAPKSEGAIVTSGPKDTRAPQLLYIRALLDDMVRDTRSGLTAHRAALFLRVLSRIMDDSSVYPAVTPDGNGGISFEWSAHRMLLEMELSIDGRYCVFHTDAQGSIGMEVEGSVHNLPLVPLRRIVREFTDYVVAHNPAWRSNFN
jgi:hypothetical protein